MQFPCQEETRVGQWENILVLTARLEKYLKAEEVEEDPALTVRS